MSPKKLALIKDARIPSQLRGVTKTTRRKSKYLVQSVVSDRVASLVGKYQVKLCLSTSFIIIQNFENAKDAAKKCSLAFTK